MKNKTLYNLTIILLLGLVFLLGRNHFSSLWKNRPNEYLKAVKKINFDDATKIIIKDLQEEVLIEKDFDGWKTASKSADSKKIEQLFTGLKPEKNPIILAQSPEQLEKLDLTNNRGKIISIEISNKQKIEFKIGKRVSQNTPVMIVGQSKAYTLLDLPAISANYNKWIDLTIVDINPEDIQSYNFENNLGDSYKLVKGEENNWQFLNGIGKPDKDKIKNILTAFNPFIASQYASREKAEEYNLNLADFSINVETADNNLGFEFFNTEDGYLLKKLPEEEYYFVSDPRVDEINLTRSELTAIEE